MIENENRPDGLPKHKASASATGARTEIDNPRRWAEGWFLKPRANGPGGD